MCLRTVTYIKKKKKGKSVKKARNKDRVSIREIKSHEFDIFAMQKTSNASDRVHSFWYFIKPRVIG